MIWSVIFVHCLCIVEEYFGISYEQVVLAGGNKIVTCQAAVCHLANIVTCRCAFVDGIYSSAVALSCLHLVTSVTGVHTCSAIVDYGIGKARVAIHIRIEGVVFIFAIGSRLTILHREESGKVVIDVTSVAITSTCRRVEESFLLIAARVLVCQDITTVGAIIKCVVAISGELYKIVILELCIEAPSGFGTAIVVLMI